MRDEGRRRSYLTPSASAASSPSIRLSRPPGFRRVPFRSSKALLTTNKRNSDSSFQFSPVFSMRNVRRCVGRPQRLLHQYLSRTRLRLLLLLLLLRRTSRLSSPSFFARPPPPLIFLWPLRVPRDARRTAPRAGPPSPWRTPRRFDAHEVRPGAVLQPAPTPNAAKPAPADLELRELALLLGLGLGQF